MWNCGVSISAAGYTSLKVRGEPSQDVVVEVRSAEGRNEFGVIDHVKSFRQVNGHGYSAFRWYFVKALCNLTCKW